MSIESDYKLDYEGEQRDRGLNQLWYNKDSLEIWTNIARYGQIDRDSSSYYNSFNSFIFW